MPRVILASQSPRRRQLLGQIGLQNFELLSPDADESYDSKLCPEEIVSVLSRRKAEAAAQLLGDPAAVIIAADTMVFLDQLRLGKPRNEEEAFQMLSALSGRTHQVRTGQQARDQSGDIGCYFPATVRTGNLGLYPYRRPNG